jgi:hypothetical protein
MKCQPLRLFPPRVCRSDAGQRSGRDGKGSGRVCLSFAARFAKLPGRGLRPSPADVSRATIASRFAELQQVRVHLVFERRAHAVGRSGIDLQHGAFHEL